MDVEGLRGNGPGDKAKVFGMQEGQDDFITNRYRVDIQYRGTGGFPAERHHVPRALWFGRRSEGSLRAGHDDALQLGVPAEPLEHLPLEGECGAASSGWSSLEGGADGRAALQRRDGVAERRLRAQSALRLSRRAGWPKRHRVGVDCRDDLPQRVACESSAAGDTGQRAPLKLLYLLSLESSERLCYSDWSRMFRRQFLIGVGAIVMSAGLLAGCGSSPTSPGPVNPPPTPPTDPPPPPPPATPATLRISKILAFGDSMTYGVDSPPLMLRALDAGIAQSYPFKLQTLLGSALFRTERLGLQCRNRRQERVGGSRPARAGWSPKRIPTSSC